MDGILNEVTNTVHKQEPGTPGMETVCGATFHIAADHLRATDTDSLPASARKCSQCFHDSSY
jgi:hypothetical protein